MVEQSSAISEIIRRFDEVICQKASKNMVENMKYDLNEEINRRLCFDEAEFGLANQLGISKNRTLKDIIFDLINNRVKRSEDEFIKLITQKTQRDPGVNQAIRMIQELEKSVLYVDDYERDITKRLSKIDNEPVLRKMHKLNLNVTKSVVVLHEAVKLLL